MKAIKKLKKKMQEDFGAKLAIQIIESPGTD